MATNFTNCTKTGGPFVQLLSPITLTNDIHRL